jgi:SRSO17 transposase
LERRLKAGIPESKKSESKTVMAQSMIKALFKRFRHGLEYVVFDALYGSKVDLLWQLTKSKIPFVGDVKGKLAVYLTQPKMKIPVWSGRGRKFYKKHPMGNAILIQDYAAQLKAKDFSLLTIRNGTKGALQARYHKRKVWIHHEPSNSLMALHLLIRKDADGEIKYSLGFFNDQKVTMLRMAKAQAQRAFVERIFEEGKNILGMADYQTRSWKGFHRHVALCSLALLFLMEQKIHLKSTIGKITAYQIQELINASVKFLDSLDQTINRLTQHIPQYQRQIENQQKWLT